MKTQTIDIENLVIELGRWCNADPPCEFCLRGLPQRNKKISEEILDLFFSQVNCIGTLTIGGGESSCHLKEMRIMISSILKNNVEIQNFYIVTNGKVFRKELIDICDLLYNSICTDNEISGLCVSDDYFHKKMHKSEQKFFYNKMRYYFEIDEEEYADYKRPYARDDKELKDDIRRNSIINMGLAKKNNLGGRDLTIYLPYKEMWKDNLRVLDSELYLTYDGRLVCNCDLDYETIDSNKYTIGDIKNEKLEDILIKLPEEDDEHDFEKFWRGEN